MNRSTDDNALSSSFSSSCLDSDGSCDDVCDDEATCQIKHCCCCRCYDAELIGCFNPSKPTLVAISSCEDFGHVIERASDRIICGDLIRKEPNGAVYRCTLADESWSASSDIENYCCHLSSIGRVFVGNVKMFTPTKVCQPIIDECHLIRQLYGSKMMRFAIEPVIRGATEQETIVSVVVPNSHMSLREFVKLHDIDVILRWSIYETVLSLVRKIGPGLYNLSMDTIRVEICAATETTKQKLFIHVSDLSYLSKAQPFELLMYDEYMPADLFFNGCSAEIIDTYKYGLLGVELLGSVDWCEYVYYVTKNAFGISFDREVTFGESETDDEYDDDCDSEPQSVSVNSIRHTLFASMKLQADQESKDAERADLFSKVLHFAVHDMFTLDTTKAQKRISISQAISNTFNILNLLQSLTKFAPTLRQNLFHSSAKFMMIDTAVVWVIENLFAQWIEDVWLIKDAAAFWFKYFYVHDSNSAIVSADAMWDAITDVISKMGITDSNIILNVKYYLAYCLGFRQSDPFLPIRAHHVAQLFKMTGGFSTPVVALERVWSVIKEPSFNPQLMSAIDIEDQMIEKLRSRDPDTTYFYGCRVGSDDSQMFTTAEESSEIAQCFPIRFTYALTYSSNPKAIYRFSFMSRYLDSGTNRVSHVRCYIKSPNAIDAKVNSGQYFASNTYFSSVQEMVAALVVSSYRDAKTKFGL